MYKRYSHQQIPTRARVRLPRVHLPAASCPQVPCVATDPLSVPMPKKESVEQASGEVVYHDDEGNGACLYAAFVPATQANAKITSIDAEAALAMPGVLAFVGADEIPGANTVAFAAPGQEELFVAIGEEVAMSILKAPCLKHGWSRLYSDRLTDPCIYIGRRSAHATSGSPSALSSRGRGARLRRRPRL
eukprot:SAG11_NODE_7651_length_1115_cov_1.044291_1_plen_189_part_00